MIIKENISDLKERMAMEIFGRSRRDSLAKGICLNCGENAIDKCYSEAGRREYLITVLCEECFDSIAL